MLPYALVGFHGKLGSGKDTAGARLAALVDLPSEQLSFARKLKQSAAALWGIPVAQWEQLKNEDDCMVYLVRGATEEYGGDVAYDDIVAQFSAREHLQRYGTESHRDVFGHNFWVEQAMPDRALRYGLDYFTDVRFENEARAIKERGGFIVEVLGPYADTGSHESELGIPGSLVDFELPNGVRDDNFAGLDAGLRRFAQQIGLPTHHEARV